MITSPHQSLRIWNYATGECKQFLAEHSNVVEAVAWAPEIAHAAINELATGEVHIHLHRIQNKDWIHYRRNRRRR